MFSSILYPRSLLGRVRAVVMGRLFPSRSGVVPMIRRLSSCFLSLTLRVPLYPFVLLDLSTIRLLLPLLDRRAF